MNDERNVLQSPVSLFKKKPSNEELAKDEKQNNKLYLVLLVGEDNNSSIEKERRTFEWIKGTVTAFNLLVECMIDTDEVTWDAMISSIIVDSPNISISKGISVYEFLKHVIDNPDINNEDLNLDNLNLDELYYDTEEAES